MKKTVKWIGLGLLFTILISTAYVFKKTDGFSVKKTKVLYLELTQKPWQEQYAYALGKGALPYLFPYFYSAQIRWKWTNVIPKDPTSQPYAPINHFWHANKLADHHYQDGGTPNNDTIYSTAWVHVDKEPIILSHPDMGDRYFSFHFTKVTSDILAVVSSQSTGSKSGHFALVPQGFKDELPQGVQALKTAQGSWYLLLARTMVKDQSDLAAVKLLQQQYQLTPLSYWEKPQDSFPKSRAVWQPFNAKEDPLAHWKTINKALAEDPPPQYENALLSLLADLHIGPNQNIDTLDEDSKRGLARAMEDGLKMMLMARASIPGGDVINGWRRNPVNAGNLGEAGDYFTRGVIQSFKGLSPSIKTEARYFGRSLDEKGEPLHGSKRYQLTFKAGEEPPVNAFWSLTLYGMDANLVGTTINRYSIGDRSQKLKYNDDGSLAIYIQHESPGKDKESNWLPAPNDNFNLTFRAYGPKRELFSGKWVVPQLSTN